MQRAPQPSYQQGLDAIARYLDRYGYDDLVLCELADGYVARVTREGELQQAIPFPISDVQELVRVALEEPGRTKPMGNPPPGPHSSFVRRTLGRYRDFMGAFGRQCDQLGASSLMIVELPDAVLVAYQKAQLAYDARDTTNCEYLYNEQGLRKLILGNSPAVHG